MKISMKTKRITAAMLAASMVLAATACAKEERQTFTGDKTEEPAYQANLDVISPIAYSETDGLNLEPGTYISIIGKDEASAFWKNVKKGVQQAEEDLNKTLGYTGNDKVKVTYNAPAKKENIDEQVNILDEELARYPDVVGVASIDADACSVQFDLATENGIPVIALDSGNNYQGIQCTVKTDNAEAAKTGAYKLADAMGRTGDILLLVHDSKSETAKERTEAFCAEIEEKYPDVNVTVFYIDVRTPGKNFDEFYRRAVEEYGVNYIKGQVGKVAPQPNGQLLVQGVDLIDNKQILMEADMVVLATAIEPDPSVRKIATMLTASIDTNNFLTEAHPKLRPVESPTAGIFLSGVCQGPKDIPETVSQAGAAAVKSHWTPCKG